MWNIMICCVWYVWCIDDLEISCGNHGKSPVNLSSILSAHDFIGTLASYHLGTKSGNKKQLQLNVCASSGDAAIGSSEKKSISRILVWTYRTFARKTTVMTRQVRLVARWLSRRTMMADLFAYMWLVVPCLICLIVCHNVSMLLPPRSFGTSKVQHVTRHTCHTYLPVGPRRVRSSP